MVFYGVTEEIEPEERELRQDAALVGDSAAEDVIEGGDAVGRDEEELVVRQSVDIADFAACGKREGAEVGLKKRRSHHVDGITIVSLKSVEGKKQVNGL
jgi:hypothetical protein